MIVLSVEACSTKPTSASTPRSPLDWPESAEAPRNAPVTAPMERELVTNTFLILSTADPRSLGGVSAAVRVPGPGGVAGTDGPAVEIRVAGRVGRAERAGVDVQDVPCNLDVVVLRPSSGGTARHSIAAVALVVARTASSDSRPHRNGTRTGAPVGAPSSSSYGRTTSKDGQGEYETGKTPAKCGVHETTSRFHRPSPAIIRVIADTVNR